MYYVQMRVEQNDSIVNVRTARAVVSRSGLWRHNTSLRLRGLQQRRCWDSLQRP